MVSKQSRTAVREKSTLDYAIVFLVQPKDLV